MAKRRLNKKFGGILVGSIAGVIVLFVAGYALRDRLFKEKPDKYVQRGRQYLEQKDYANARDNLAKAASLSRPDPALNTMLGVALNNLTSKEPDNVAAARAQWEQALGIEPGYIPAYEHLIQFWRDDLDLRIRPSSRAQAALKLQSTAVTMRKFDKDNLLGRAAQGEAVIEQLLDGIQVGADSLKDAQDLLAGVHKDDPDDAEAVYSLARSIIWQGQEAGRANDPKAQADFYANAVKVMSDAVDARPSAYMHYRLGQVYLQLVAAKRTPGEPTQEIKDLVNRAVIEVDKARAMAKPDDLHFVDINLYDARLVLERPWYTQQSGIDPTGQAVPVADAASGNAPGRLDRLAAAESIYRNVLKQRPDEAATRLALAQLLGVLPGRSKEAIAVLSEPFTDNSPAPGIKGTLLPIYENEANVKLLGLKLDAFEETRDRKVQANLLAECDQLCDKAYGRSPDSAGVLAMKGRLELAHRRITEAVQTLRRSLTLMDPHDPVVERSRYEVMYYLARAYVSAQQTGEAKKLLNEIARVYDHFVPARVLLARLLVTEHANDEAKPHVDYLERILPDNPNLLNDVVRMRIAMADGPDKAEIIKRYYDMSPETNASERREKGATARVAQYASEAIRLYSAVHSELPGDVDAATQLANLYLADGHADKASQVVNEAVAVSPLDPTLLAMKMQLDGKGSTAASADVKGAAAVAAVTHELEAADAARLANDVAGRDQHIANAERIRPEDVRVWDAIFMLALDEHNWDRASVYLEKLATANADHAGGLLYRVRFALSRNELVRASELALQLTHEKPEFSQSWSVLAQVQKSAGRYDDAITNFKLALDRQTQNADALRGLIDCAYAQGDIDGARQYIANARRIFPGNQLFREYDLGHELQYGDPQKVIEPRLAAVKAAPDVLPNWLNLGSAYMAAAKARSAANDAALAATYYTKARETFLQALAKFPDDDEASTDCSKAALALNDFPGAEKVMIDLANRPSHKGRPTAAMTLSDFYNAAGKPEMGVQVLRDYFAHPFVPPDRNNDINAQLRLASLLERLNRVDEALAALTANGDEPTVVHGKVVILIDAHRYEEADKVLTAAAAVAPLNTDLMNLRGIVALNSGRFAEARRAFDQVLNVEPANITALEQRAASVMRQPAPDFSSALADLSRARDISASDMEIRVKIADIDNRMGKPDDAVRELEAALRVAPDNKRVTLFLIDLYSKSNPPKWTDAERVIKDARLKPRLANDPELTQTEARIAMEQNKLQLAQQLITSAMSADPSNQSMVRTYYDILTRSKQFSLLIEETDRFLSGKNDSNLWWVYPYRAVARSRGTSDKAGSVDEFQHALALAAAAHDNNAVGQIMRALAAELGPDTALRIAMAHADEDAHWNMIAATLCAQKGDHPAAIHWVEKAMDAGQFSKLSSGDQDAALRLAATEYQEETPPDVLKAADVYRKLIDRSPQDISSLNNLACLLVDQGSPAFNQSEALKFAEMAYNAMSQSGAYEPLVVDTYGWALIVNGHNADGVQKVQEAIDKRADLPEPHYHKAEGLLMRQPPDQDEAKAELFKALQLLTQTHTDGRDVDQTLLSKVQTEYDRAKKGFAG